MKIKLLLALGISVIGAHAASITVNDSSFENNANVTAPGGWGNDLSPEWQERGGANNGESFEEWIDGFAADGNNHVGMATGAYIWQDTGVALAPNTTYTLTIAAGNRSGQSQAGNVTTYALLAGAANLGATNYADTGAVVADTNLVLGSASVDATVLAGAGSFADADSLIVTTGATVPAENLVILLGDASGAGRSHFDNIRLDATASAIPEVSTSLLGALAGLVLLRRRR